MCVDVLLPMAAPIAGDGRRGIAERCCSADAIRAVEISSKTSVFVVQR